LRAHLETRPIPDDIRAAVLAAFADLGAEHSYAVRSSATAEDLAGASFAGQQDTYLNVRGGRALLDRVRACWASLYTDRAILYRAQNRIAHRDVSLCVVVQRMVRSEKSGILFTADPMTGHRGVMAVEAGFGLGESLVSGLVSADLYKIDKRARRVISVTVGDKKLAIVPAPPQDEIDGSDGGGTVQIELDQDTRSRRVLDDAELAALADAGLRIEELQGAPQDIEWCIEASQLYIVQSRPITSLYPLPAPAPDDDSLHVMACFNHFQVMTDAMSPMAQSVFQLIVPFGRARDQIVDNPWVRLAGGRLFIDLSEILRVAPLRKRLLGLLGGVDRLTAGALAEVAGRETFQTGPRVPMSSVVGAVAPVLARAMAWLWFRDPTDAAERTAAELDALEIELDARIKAPGQLSGRLRRAREVLADVLYRLFHVPSMIMAGLLAGRVIERLAPAETGELQALARGLSGNVTTDMDLAVGDLADHARARPELASWLLAHGQGAEPTEALPGPGGARILAELERVPGSAEFRAELGRFLDRYGMRAPSEIDLARPRWRDDPSSILKAVAGNLAHLEPGAHRAHHDRLAREAEIVAETLVARARRGAAGWLRARLVGRMIRVHRELLAVREHPKYLMVRVFDVVRGQVLNAAAELCAQGRLNRPEDVWWLRMDELIAALDDPGRELHALVQARAAEHERHVAMHPPRVMTSEGEIPVAEHQSEMSPDNALVGSPASAGQVEGIARVIRDPTREVLHKGEILVAPFTDPGWTPLFLNAAGLVMEVGGLMTHGSVVAREYGIPAVVCVPDATRRIRTGQRVRVHGDLGYVEILDQPAEESTP
jgi:rifampicin phosphotransferase